MSALGHWTVVPKVAQWGPPESCQQMCAATMGFGHIHAQGREVLVWSLNYFSQMKQEHVLRGTVL